jgi:hypothetical protein
LVRFVQALAATLVEDADLRQVSFVEIVTHVDHRMRNTNTASSAYLVFDGLEL